MRCDRLQRQPLLVERAGHHPVFQQQLAAQRLVRSDLRSQFDAQIGLRQAGLKLRRIDALRIDLERTQHEGVKWRQHRIALPARAITIIICSEQHRAQIARDFGLGARLVLCQIQRPVQRERAQRIQRQCRIQLTECGLGMHLPQRPLPVVAAQHQAQIGYLIARARPQQGDLVDLQRVDLDGQRGCQRWRQFGRLADFFQRLDRQPRQMQALDADPAAQQLPWRPASARRARPRYSAPGCGTAGARCASCHTANRAPR